MLQSNSSEFWREGVPLSVSFETPEDFLIFIFQILFATATVLLAGTVVISISATKELLAQNRFIFMLNTSICDTLVGFSVFYLGLFDVQEGYPSRNGTFNVLNSLLGINILTFIFAQFDRYFAVCHPFIYSRFATKPVVIGCNVYCWIHNICHLLVRNLLPVSKSFQMYVISIILFQLMVLTKVIMTIKLYVRGREPMAREPHMALLMVTYGSRPLLYVIARYQLEREPPSAEKESKMESLRVIIFVVISFLALWCPSFVNIIIRFVSGGGLTFRNEATNPFANLARFSSLCTPSVYMWVSPVLRKASVRTVWGRVCPKCKRRVGPCQRKSSAKSLH